jgi:predicted nuclease of predicted toxin-antitoxin system
VKFLVDHQLPPALAQQLRSRGFDCQHVLEAGLADALDIDICRYAEAQERIIVSKDEDFLYLVTKSRHWPSIERSLKAGDQIIEIR